jgi:hypothetical protein
MRKWLFIVLLLGLVTIGVPMTAAALGLDVEAKAGAGIGLGTTDNSDITGAARLAADGGIGVDLYLLVVGPVDLGLSTGVDYSYLTFHSTWSNFFGQPTDQTTDATYNYINVPIALVGSMPLNPTLRLVVRAGAFIGYFLNGTADVTYTPELGGPFTNGSVDLDSSNTIRMEYGLHFTAGVDWDLGGGLAVAPALQFDMGLTDTSKNSTGNDFNDTFWSLTLMVGIKYKVL